MIAFAAGRGGHADSEPNRDCVPDRLVQAAGKFGRTARIPTLWLYAENDSYFAPGLSKRMAAAFKNAGGRADYRLLPAIGRDGHPLMESRAASKLWAPIVANFLERNRARSGWASSGHVTFHAAAPGLPRSL